MGVDNGEKSSQSGLKYTRVTAVELRRTTFSSRIVSPNKNKSTTRIVDQ